MENFFTREKLDFVFLSERRLKGTGNGSRGNYYYREKQILSQSKALIAKELNWVATKCFLFPQETKQEERKREEEQWGRRRENEDRRGEGGAFPILPSHSWLPFR